MFTVGVKFNACTEGTDRRTTCHLMKRFFYESQGGLSGIWQKLQNRSEDRDDRYL